MTLYDTKDFLAFPMDVLDFPVDFLAIPMDVLDFPVDFLAISVGCPWMH